MQLGTIEAPGLRPSDSDFAQNWPPGTGEIPLLFSNDPMKIPRGLSGD
jgi:hypothetical protein